MEISMSEQDAIARSGAEPNTAASLEKEFAGLGLRPGMTVIVHSSLSALGWVCGGAPSVILSLENAVTDEGTLVMPAHSGDLSDPGHWCNPPVPESWMDTIRAEMPCFDRDLTPTRGIGKIPETFRKQRGVVRSSHPQVSFAAWGKRKDYIVQDDHYDFAQNERSPLGRLYELDGWILLIGVGYDNNTSLHLAEYKAAYPAKKSIKNGMPVPDGGKTRWAEFDDVDISTDDFCAIGEVYEKDHPVISGMVGSAACKLIRQRSLVDFAVRWMEENRI
jgi:aminoglycoside 3-N-acetyltransferase